MLADPETTEGISSYDQHVLFDRLLKFCFFSSPGRVQNLKPVFLWKPGDGSCLFHSLAHGMGGMSASILRRDIAGFIQARRYGH